MSETLEPRLEWLDSRPTFVLRLYLPFLQLPLKQKMGVFHYVRPWMFGFILAGIPVATYTWMIYTRPDVYSQVGMLLGPGAVCTVPSVWTCGA